MRDAEHQEAGLPVAKRRRTSANAGTDTPTPPASPGTTAPHAFFHTPPTTPEHGAQPPSPHTPPAENIRRDSKLVHWDEHGCPEQTPARDAAIRDRRNRAKQPSSYIEHPDTITQDFFESNQIQYSAYGKVNSENGIYVTCNQDVNLFWKNLRAIYITFQDTHFALLITQQNTTHVASLYNAGALVSTPKQFQNIQFEPETTDFKACTLKFAGIADMQALMRPMPSTVNDLDSLPARSRQPGMRPGGAP